MGDLAAIWDARLSDAGTLTVTSAASGLPVTNLQSVYPWKVWRSTSAADQTIDLDLGAATSIDAIALVNHNLDDNGTWRIYLDDNSSSFASPTYDPGAADIHETTIDTDLLGRLQPTAIRVLSAPVSARYARIVLSNTGNATGYLQAGRLVVGLSERIGINRPYTIDATDLGQLKRTPYGNQWPEARATVRKWKLTLAHKTEDDLVVDIWGKYWRTKGKGGDLMICPRPDKASLYHLEAGYAVMTGFDPLANNFGSRFSGALECEEFR